MLWLGEAIVSAGLDRGWLLVVTCQALGWRTTLKNMKKPLRAFRNSQTFQQQSCSMNLELKQAPLIKVLPSDLPNMYPYLITLPSAKFYRISLFLAKNETGINLDFIRWFTNSVIFESCSLTSRAQPRLSLA